MFPPHDMPDQWSAEQTLAVCEWLDSLRERLWAHYGQQLEDRCRSNRRDQTQPDLFDLDDELPF